MAVRSAKFASARRAWGMCDVCGIRARLCDLRSTSIRGHLTNVLACPTCWDPDHPQNFLDQAVVSDAQALRNPRPDTGRDASRTLYPPGNWINGQPPTLAQQMADLVAENAAALFAKRRTAEEQLAWLRANQRMQGVSR